MPALGIFVIGGGFGFKKARFGLMAHLVANQMRDLGGQLGTIVQQRQCFALYALPGATHVELVAGDRLRVFDSVDRLFSPGDGFLLCPFDFKKSRQYAVIPRDVFFDYEMPRHAAAHLVDEKMDHEWSESLTQLLEKGSNGADYDYPSAVEKVVGDMQNGALEKVVLSRFKQVKTVQKGLLRLFLELYGAFPNAFVSLHYTPLYGLWVGATPESLVTVDAQKVFSTMALAGTKKIAPGQSLSDVAWTQKEIEEQAMVSRYIIDCFKSLRVRQFKEKGPETVRSGNLAHLKTSFSVDLDAVNYPDLGIEMLNLLHPTSAVCGMPLETSFDMIRQIESFDRALFAGVIGPLSSSKGDFLYVNLRCAQLFCDSAFLYAGAGLTRQSNPRNEAQEIFDKMDAIKAFFL